MWSTASLFIFSRLL
uniref:Uncharacterized protein n=1 Tax=Anguilla anguilla TaxID=7936 RepID=A0A0E9Q008_ANGAN